MRLYRPRNMNRLFVTRGDVDGRVRQFILSMFVARRSPYLTQGGQRSPFRSDIGDLLRQAIRQRLYLGNSESILLNGARSGIEKVRLEIIVRGKALPGRVPCLSLVSR
jgi:hypothetical protein